MKKQHTEVFVNNSTQDGIISYKMRVEKNEIGEINWTDKDNCIAKCKGNVVEVLIYAKDSNDYEKVNVIKISPQSIKNLYAQIVEIEQLSSEEFIEP